MKTKDLTIFLDCKLLKTLYPQKGGGGGYRTDSIPFTLFGLMNLRSLLCSLLLATAARSRQLRLGKPKVGVANTRSNGSRQRRILRDGFQNLHRHGSHGTGLQHGDDSTCARRGVCGISRRISGEAWSETIRQQSRSRRCLVCRRAGTNCKWTAHRRHASGFAAH